jgi:hypothetical protein
MSKKWIKNEHFSYKLNSFIINYCIQLITQDEKCTHDEHVEYKEPGTQ